MNSTKTRQNRPTNPSREERAEEPHAVDEAFAQLHDLSMRIDAGKAKEKGNAEFVRTIQEQIGLISDQLKSIESQRSRLVNLLDNLNVR